MAENKNTAASKNKAMKFFKETKAEMKKVSWPTKNQLFHNTLIIVVFIIIATVVLSLLDAGFEKVLSLILK
ncbi:MAG: preprotein translocase subunit SecE [Clostridiales bacterium]|nr:preprotein translocase subunit SecE [Clostridiales bacterium]